MVLVKGHCRNSQTSLSDRNNSCCTTSHHCIVSGGHNGPCSTHHKIQTPGYLQNKCEYTYTQKRKYYDSTCANIIQKNCGLLPMTDITIKNEKEKGLWFWYSLNSWHFPLNKIICFNATPGSNVLFTVVENLQIFETIVYVHIYNIYIK